MRDGAIMALDLAVNLGVAVGRPGTVPQSFALRLRKPQETSAAAFAALQRFMADWLGRGGIAALIKEAPISLDGFARLHNGEHVVRATYGYHAVVEGACAAFGVPWTEVHVTTVRKHFIGRGTFADRAAAKAAVVKRCQLLGYLPKDCTDDNRADALACWDFASAHVGKTPGAFRLFGEEAVA